MRSDTWKEGQNTRHEQIIAEAGQESVVPRIGHVIDATGAVVRT